MKKSIMEMWVKALRSGKYKQGKSYLNYCDEKYCCLGVLCDLYNKQLCSSGEEGIKYRHAWNLWYTYDGLDGALPRCVMEWAGIHNTYGKFENDEYLFDYMNVENNLPSLAQLNDGVPPENNTFNLGIPKTFKEIADIIESNYSRL